MKKTLKLIAYFYGSLRTVADKVEKDTGIKISNQTIENWILKTKNYNKDKITRFSEYYIFNIQWIKIQGD